MAHAETSGALEILREITRHGGETLWLPDLGGQIRECLDKTREGCPGEHEFCGVFFGSDDERTGHPSWGSATPERRLELLQTMADWELARAQYRYERASEEIVAAVGAFGTPRSGNEFVTAAEATMMDPAEATKSAFPDAPSVAEFARTELIRDWAVVHRALMLQLQYWIRFRTILHGGPTTRAE